MYMYEENCEVIAGIVTKGEATFISGSMGPTNVVDDKLHDDIIEACVQQSGSDVKQVIFKVK